MFNAVFYDFDHGWNDFKKNIKKIDRDNKKAVGVGLFDNSDVVDRAEKNEFGDPPRLSRPWSIPKRSFLRRTFDVNRRSYEEYMGKLGLDSISGKISFKEALNKIGEKVKTDIVNFIDSDYYKVNKPNSPVTITKKGSDHPLIDTGEMRDSIKHKRMSNATNKE